MKQDKEIARYHFLEAVGRGTGGVVYKGLDTRINTVRALKVIQPGLAQDPAFRTRLREAVHALVRLRHIHLVMVYGVSEADVSLLLVMEYVAGTSLGDLVRRDGPLGYHAMVSLFKQLLIGLAYAHRKGFTHGGLNPADVLVSPEGHGKISGIGLAFGAGGEDYTPEMLPDALLPYLSPEHVRRKARVDHRSDLYAVGALGYEALTGRPPFLDEGPPHKMLRAVLEGDIVPPVRVNPDVPEAVSDLVMRALARDPADRYQTADEMLAALTALKLRVPERSTRVRQEPPRSVRERRRAGQGIFYGGILATLLVAAFLAWWALRDVVGSAARSSSSGEGSVDTVQVSTGVLERIVSQEGAERGGRRLVLRSRPLGSISVEGQVVGVDSVQVPVGPGPWHVAFVHPDYGERRVVVEVAEGQMKEVTYFFEGYVQVEAHDEEGHPLPAYVRVDDRLTGHRTPLVRPMPLAPGRHTLSVHLEGYLGALASVVVLPAAGEQTRVAVPPVARLRLVLRRHP